MSLFQTSELQTKDTVAFSAPLIVKHQCSRSKKLISPKPISTGRRQWTSVLDPEAPKRGNRLDPPTAVVAMGGHAFIKDGEIGTNEDHVNNSRATCKELMTLIERGYRLVITHGNGPQVGDLLTRFDMTREDRPGLPLDVLVAQTEGSLGYYLQRGMLNEMHERGIKKFVSTMLSEVVVSSEDPAFRNPTKPVGPSLTKEDAELHRKEYDWVIGEDRSHNWHRLVPSPRPVQIVQAKMIYDAVCSDSIIVTGGGGGIPVLINDDGEFVGVEAVIDKDLTSGVLATELHADLLIILTNVDGAYLDFGGDNPRRLGAVTMAECERFMKEDHFAAGSMGPKVQAIYEFLQRGGRRGLITSAECLQKALEGESGTHFLGRI